MAISHQEAKNLIKNSIVIKDYVVSIKMDLEQINQLLIYIDRAKEVEEVSKMVADHTEDFPDGDGCLDALRAVLNHPGDVHCVDQFVWY